ncbi:MAG: fumarylacetoacetate hydrolase family protein [Chloroflexota bacterium]
MRLVTFRTINGHAHVGVVRNDTIVDLNRLLAADNDAALHRDFDMVDFIEMGDNGLDLARHALAAADDHFSGANAPVKLDESILLAPIPKPRKNVMCMGRNYAEHAAESVRAFNEAPSAADKPEYLNMFTKATTTINSPFGNIPYSAAMSEEIDWEVELALVIGKTGKNIKQDRAMSHIYGYMVLNDISARDIQKRHANQYFKGKSLDGSCPIGPWIVTADEIADPSNLDIALRVNGVEKQHDNTRSMLFSIPEIIEQLSEGLTLEPGDIIATGTPSGVGMGRTPREFLRPGDVVECEIEHIGKIRNRVISV